MIAIITKGARAKGAGDPVLTAVRPDGITWTGASITTTTTRNVATTCTTCHGSASSLADGEADATGIQAVSGIRVDRVVSQLLERLSEGMCRCCLRTTRPLRLGAPRTI